MIEWKCVTKCLPKRDESVLVCIQNNKGTSFTYRVGSFCPHEGWIYCKADLHNPKIAAWSDLPEFPEFVDKSYLPFEKNI